MLGFFLKTTTLFVLLFTLGTGFAATKVCIDPGHGGTDSGAVGCGQYEDTNNLNTGLKFRNWLNADTNDGAGGSAWTVYMTRSTDVFISLSGRCTYANNNGVARFMSIHNNACGCNATGTETFCHTSLGTSADLRNKIQQRILNAWGLTNRGNKTATFYVLTYTSMPATLVELGFIDRCSPDAAYLGNATHQDNAALGKLYAIQTHIGVAAYRPGSTPSLPTYTNDSPVCSANWSTGTSATDKYGTNYRFRSTAALSDAAEFSINVGTAGTYRIQAWWCAGTNRSATAPFIAPDNATVNVNQQINGGKFNVLKSLYLGTGAKVTKLSCWTTTGYVVVADAVRYGP